jgi:FKBP-type peptidyl-prolyl cis-trans isomerase FkpA
MLTRVRSLIAGLCAALLLTSACSLSSDTASGPVDPTSLTFNSALGVNLSAMTKTASGLYIQDQIVGTGAVVTAGSTATVDYTGWLHDATQFDTSVGKTPFTVQNVGNANVIAGWNEGLIGMRVGGRRLLVIPYTLGYGAQARGTIPAYATLVFRIDLRSVP